MDEADAEATPSVSTGAAAGAIGDAFITALLADFAAGGAEAIRRCRQDSPATYLKICVALLPKQLAIEGANDLDEAELDRRIRELARRLALEIGAARPPPGEGPPVEPPAPVGLPARR